MNNYDMTFNPMSVHTLGEELYNKFNEYGRGRITIEQFIMLYLGNELDDYIEKVKKEIRGETDDRPNQTND